MVDVAIIGDGVIGLSTACELGRAGASVRMFGSAEPGAASLAAAGLLAPSIGDLSNAVSPFFADSLARYPQFVDRLREYDSELVIVEGLIDISTPASAATDAASRGHRLSVLELAEMEPALAAGRGGLLQAMDGAIDNVRLVRALHRAVAALPSISYVPADAVARIELGGPIATVVTQSGARVAATTLVLATGAWSAGIAGLPRALPVFPLKGQMLAVGFTSLRRPIVGDDVYLVPRHGEVVIGATAEHAGFDVTVDEAAIEQLRRAAIALCPSIADAPVLRTWAGIRPATPDMLPILGPDPDCAQLLYATGHSKNGILLAPGTSAAIAAIASGLAPSVGLEAFSIARFPPGESMRSVTF